MSDKATELEDKSEDKEDKSEESGKMSFLEHLDELRKRLVHIAFFIALGFCASAFFSKHIYNFLAEPLVKVLPQGTKLVFMTPTAPFTTYMKVAFLGSVILTIPFTMFEVWKFIAPGLYRKEKKFVVPFLISSVFLFIGGAAFCYYQVLPNSYKFLINLGSSFTPMIAIDEYLDLTNMVLLGFGLIFEMPVLAAFLSMFGLVSASFLWNKLKYAIIIIVIIAAILSPTGDAYNLLIWSAPMIVLYFISIGVAFLFGWRRKSKGLV
jgi:sec-independent protein translocase protein TatC